MPVLNWISDYAQIDRPAEDMESTIADFTIMWAFFETCYPDRITFENIRNRIASLNIENSEELTGVHLFLHRRYFAEDSERSFNALAWRDGRSEQAAKNFTEQVLSSRQATAKETLEAALYVAYRVRNNLFHGVKQIPVLHESKDLFEYMITLLQFTCSALNLHLPTN